MNIYYHGFMKKLYYILYSPGWMDALLSSLHKQYSTVQVAWIIVYYLGCMNTPTSMLHGLYSKMTTILSTSEYSPIQYSQIFYYPGCMMQLYMHHHLICINILLPRLQAVAWTSLLSRLHERSIIRCMNTPSRCLKNTCTILYILYTYVLYIQYISKPWTNSY
jgi:hypothetical protein